MSTSFSCFKIPTLPILVILLFLHIFLYIYNYKHGLIFSSLKSQLKTPYVWMAFLGWPPPIKQGIQLLASSLRFILLYSIWHQLKIYVFGYCSSYPTKILTPSGERLSLLFFTVTSLLLSYCQIIGIQEILISLHGFEKSNVIIWSTLE